MTILFKFLMDHPTWAVIAVGAIWNAFVGSLSAPTDKSGAFYVFFFKFANALAFNFQRAKSTSIENSPNFLPAVERYLAQQNVPSQNPIQK